MKIISFGDVHMATRNLDRMGEVMRDCDLVIVSGDLTNFGGVEDARKVIADVRRACPAVLALPGNLDQREVIPFLEADGIALHGKGRVIGGVGIFGCGGSNISPFDTPTEFTEDEIYATLRAGYDFVRDVRPLLMICHPPPFDTKCDRILQRQAGRQHGRAPIHRRGEARRLHLGTHPRIRRRRSRSVRRRFSTRARSRAAAI